MFTFQFRLQGIWQVAQWIAIVLLVAGCRVTTVDEPSVATPTATEPTLTATVSTPSETPTLTPTPPIVTTLHCGGETVEKPTNAVVVSVVYGPDFTEYMEDVIHRFNCDYARKVDPVNKDPLEPNAPVIYVTGEEIPSGEAAERLSFNDSAAVPFQPTIYIPSSRLWLSLVNAERGRVLFDVDAAPASAVAPVVMAIWESYLQKLQAQYGQAIGWRELMELFQADNGWQSVGLSQKAIGYGHTNPYISSAGLAAWTTEFYAAARYCTTQGEPLPLTLEMVENEDVQNCVRQIEQAVKHYSAHTVIFREYIVEGPSYVSIVPLEENDLILINEGKWGKPPEKLVALYPNDGTFLSEHPLAIPNADWVSAEQRAAAEQFIAFVLTKEMQQLTMAYAFRPADSTIRLDARFGPDNGVDPNQPNPATLLSPPAPPVLRTIQRQWGLIKKQAEIILLIDVSGSMADEVKIADGNGGEKTVTKLQQAQLAAQTFLRDQPHGNKVTLGTFNNIVSDLPDMCVLEECRDDLIAAIDNLTAKDGTALFDALHASIQQLSQITNSNRIKAIVVISDGGDTASDPNLTLDHITEALRATQETRSPVLVIPVAYAYTDEDKRTGLGTLEAIAEAARTKVLEGDISEINELLRAIGEYF